MGVVNWIVASLAVMASVDFSDVMGAVVFGGVVEAVGCNIVDPAVVLVRTQSLLKIH
jgi:hypothetical protein